MMSKCENCGFELTDTKGWEKYYCNHYCCNPCCPCSKTTPCLKEQVEAIEGKMRDHLIEKGVIKK